jgi:hypothetical protein
LGLGKVVEIPSLHLREADQVAQDAATTPGAPAAAAEASKATTAEAPAKVAKHKKAHANQHVKAAQKND